VPTLRVGGRSIVVDSRLEQVSQLLMEPMRPDAHDRSYAKVRLSLPLAQTVSFRDNRGCFAPMLVAQPMRLIFRERT
jgi:hypothetical protein